MTERILQALYNLAVDAQLEYEDSGSIIPWEETARGASFIELQDAISEALYLIADGDEYMPECADTDGLY